jgi:Cu2+-containing amine oxidase
VWRRGRGQSRRRRWPHSVAGRHLLAAQDGTIEYEIKLSGELSTNLLSPGEGPKPKWGTLVMPGVNAQIHQHMFCARLDMAIDDDQGGKGLVVSEASSEAGPCPGVGMRRSSESLKQLDTVCPVGMQNRTF